jgi:hypothetical protein
MLSFFPRSTSPETREREGPRAGVPRQCDRIGAFPSLPRPAEEAHSRHPNSQGFRNGDNVSSAPSTSRGIMRGFVELGTLVKHTSPRNRPGHSWDEADDTALQTTTHADRGFRKQQGGRHIRREKLLINNGRHLHTILDWVFSFSHSTPFLLQLANKETTYPPAYLPYLI